MELNFHLAKETDLERILPLVREYFKQENLHFDEAILRTALGRLIRNPTLGKLWLISDIDKHGKPAGYLALTLGYSLEYDGRDAFVDQFFLLPQYRGRGWGRKILEHVERVIRQLGVRALHLELRRSNDAARKLYEKLGFSEHDRYLVTKLLDKPQS